MKVTEGIKILSLMTLFLSVWYLYGSIGFLNGLLTNPEYIATFDQLHINGGKTYYRVLAYLNPFIFAVTIISSIGAFKGKRVFIILIVIFSILFLANEIITHIMDEEWFHQAFTLPHFTPILYVFNVVFFSYKLWGGNNATP